MITDVPRYDMHKLRAEERPKFLFEYYVTGAGVFPFDMMRFDSCWPATGEDAARLEWERINSAKGRSLRSIRMRSYKPPTIARWASFVWSVGNERP
jgi:hypothetical protein